MVLFLACKTSDTASDIYRYLFAPTEKRTLKTSWNQAEVNLSVTRWASKFPEPKVTEQNLDRFVCSVTVNLLFFLLLCYSDTDTVVGLPRPIHESIKTLKQVRLCTSLCCLGYFLLPAVYQQTLDTLKRSSQVLNSGLFAAQVRLHRGDTGGQGGGVSEDPPVWSEWKQAI